MPKTPPQSAQWNCLNVCISNGKPYTSRGVSTVWGGILRKPTSEMMQGAAYLLYGHGGPAPAPAHPFVRPAFDTRADEAFSEIKRVLRDELKNR